MNHEKLPQRFVDKFVVCESGCWEWQAGKDTGGYGRFSWKSEYRQAHRVSYEVLVGPIPEGLVLDHLCRVRHCVNPDHLEPVTQKENCQRGDAGKVNGARQVAKTHCPAGHHYDDENLGRSGDYRWCRTCKRERSRRWKATKKSIR